MRVLMVSDVYFPRVNGVSTAIQTYRNTLLDMGTEIHLIAPSYGSEPDIDWITRVPSRRVPRSPEDRICRRKDIIATARAVAHQSRFDLLHIQTPFSAHYAGVALAKELGLPVALTYHTLFEEYLRHYIPLLPVSLMRAPLRRLTRAQCQDAHVVIAPSLPIKKRLIEYGVSTPIEILPTGIPLKKFSSGNRHKFRERFKIGAERPVALYVGRVAHEKNIPFLIHAISVVRYRIPNILLVVAGEGAAQDALKQQVSALNLSDNVLFIGYLDRENELPDCYAAADIFTFASVTETQGLVLLEAMAAGIPVIALAEMGTVDVLRPESGACVPPNDVTQFSENIVTVLQDAPRRTQMSSMGRAYADRWSDTTLGARLASLYQQTIANNQSWEHERESAQG